MHKDHLGSPISITNQSGAVVQQFAYDPWGKQTKIYQTSSFANLTYNQPTNRGYTGHEHIRDLNIIHMNGRIYDARIGRFLQADPNIQSPGNFQNYNRYSYVLNNPLSYTDPSGFFFKKLFKKLNKALGKFAPFAGLALMFIPGVGAWATANWFQAAAFGFVAGGVATGSLKGAFIGALSGAAFQQIGSHFRRLSAVNRGVAAHAGSVSGLTSFGGNLLTSGQIAAQIGSHAIAGGVISELNGGKFGHGFFSAGVTKGLGTPLLDAAGDNVVAGTLASAVIGGTASVISGGKFKNGATTAAYQTLFNTFSAQFKKQLYEAQKKLGVEVANPAIAIAEEALKDGRLTLSEANSIWRHNVDPNFTVSVDATQLTVKLTGLFEGNFADAVITGADWFVHGSNRLGMTNGKYFLESGTYDFTSNPRSWYPSYTSYAARQIATGIGYTHAHSGITNGMDFTIKYNGQPNVIPPER